MRSSFALLVLLLAAACSEAQPDPHAMVVSTEYSTCSGCHMTDYAGAKNHPGKKPTTCGVCHTQLSWHPQWLEHPWPLTGAHRPLDCAACHKGAPVVFHGTSKECVGCHRAEYEKAPNHPERFPTTCDECHSTFAWKPQFWVDAKGAGPATAKDGGVAEELDAAAAEAPLDAASDAPADAAKKPAPRWSPSRPTGTPTARPTATPTKPPDVVSYPSPRR